MKKLRFYLAALMTTLCALSALVFVSVPAHALFEGSTDQACNGAGLQDTGGCAATNDKSNQVASTLKSILNILSFIVGVVAVIMIIIGGIRFVTSQGEASSTALARNTIIYAIVGLFVAAVAQVLVHFVIGKATK